MSISALTPTALPQVRTPEAMEGPGPDHDGDSDDKGIAAATVKPTSAPPPQGTGAVVDTKA